MIDILVGPKNSPMASVSSLSNTAESQSVNKIDFTDVVYVDDIDSDSDLDVLEFDVQSQVGRLPDSSYTDQETLFTWSDITGNLINSNNYSILNRFIIYW